MSAGPAFYDALLDNPGSAYLNDSGGPYEDLYRLAALLVPGKTVVDIGCGTGRFAKILLDAGHTAGYVGIDFSPRLIREARRHCPQALYLVSDVRTAPIWEADVYVILEVLEHLDDDLGLLDRLPSGATVVLSVPSFDSESHLRFFPEPGDARRRYDELVRFNTEQIVSLRPGVFFHLLSGTVR